MRFYIARNEVKVARNPSMADELGKNLRSLFDTLSSTSPSRGSEAASIATDLHSLCVERITDVELGAQ